MQVGMAEHAGEIGRASWWEWWSMLVRMAEQAGGNGGACW